MYNPYGEVARPQGNGGANGGGRRGGAGEILYSGCRADPEIGLHQVRFGFYHPTLGRWVSRDIPYIDGTNLYAYSSGDPLGGADPSGRLKVDSADTTRRDVTTGDAGYTHAYDYWLTIEVSVRPPRKNEGNQCFCVLKPKQKIVYGVRLDVPTEADIRAITYKSNYQDIVTGLRSAVDMTLLITRPPVTRESVLAHELQHVQDWNSLAQKAWNAIEGSIGIIRADNLDECKNKVNDLSKDSSPLSKWRAKYRQMDVGRAPPREEMALKRAREGEPYRRQQESLNRFAQELEDMWSTAD